MKTIVRLAGTYVGLSSWYCGSKVRSFGQWATANCSALPTVNAGSTPLRTVNRCCMVSLYIHRVSKKLCQCYFVNNSVKHWQTLIIFGVQHREET